MPSSPNRDLVRLQGLRRGNETTSPEYRQLLIAAAVENRGDLDRVVRAIPDAEQCIVCRLKVDLSTARQRVKVREPGIFQEKFVARVEKLEKILDRANLENFCVDNPDGRVTEAASRMLVGTGWI